MPKKGAAEPSSTSGPSLNQSEMVLVAFHRAAGGSTARVPYEELVLQAWKDFPDQFSLRNHPEHPDASDVHKKLYQSLKTEGLVVSLGNKIFRLTDKGVERAKSLLQQIDASAAPSSRNSTRLARSEQSLIEHALRTRTYQTWKQGGQEKLIDYDVRMFFQFSTATPLAERKLRVARAFEAIQKARGLGIERADELESLASFLTDKFSRLVNSD